MVFFWTLFLMLLCHSFVREYKFDMMVWLVITKKEESLVFGIGSIIKGGVSKSSSYYH